MRLAKAARDLPDLAGAVEAVLDARLLKGDPRPLAVALSGGGDSVALLLIARDWAARAGRPLLVLSVDHRLQPESAAWTRASGERAERLGLGFRALAWEGPKPVAGLPAAARAARHRLLAQAAREAGARVILMGHTADDVLEARAMQAAGATTPLPREWAPSPAWPEGRGIFLLRPLLGIRRAALRDWLAARGEDWIEDPANQDLRYARARARAALRPAAEALVAAPEPAAARLAKAARVDEAGVVTIRRAALRGADPAAARALLSIACLCAAGTARPPPASRLETLRARIAAGEAFAATLAGARVEAAPDAVRLFREAGEAARGGLSPLSLAADETGVWDGRFEVRATRGITVRALAGLATGLSKPSRSALRRFPAKARGGLPAILADGRLVGCPVLAPVPGAELRALARERLLAACGSVTSEPGG